jgi:hypothetical protein
VQASDSGDGASEVREGAAPRAVACGGGDAREGSDALCACADKDVTDMAGSVTVADNDIEFAGLAALFGLTMGERGLAPGDCARGSGVEHALVEGRGCWCGAGVGCGSATTSGDDTCAKSMGVLPVDTAAGCGVSNDSLFFWALVVCATCANALRCRFDLRTCHSKSSSWAENSEVYGEEIGIPSSWGLCVCIMLHARKFINLGCRRERQDRATGRRSRDARRYLGLEGSSMVYAILSSPTPRIVSSRCVGNGGAGLLRALSGCLEPTCSGGAPAS